MLHELYSFFLLFFALKIQTNYSFINLQLISHNFESLSKSMTNVIHLILYALILYFYSTLNFSFHFFYPYLNIFSNLLYLDWFIHIHPQLIPKSVFLYYLPISVSLKNQMITFQSHCHFQKILILHNHDCYLLSLYVYSSHLIFSFY